MPLINCPDCDKQVSSSAPACPGCGSPIGDKKESAGSGVQRLATVQETSKKLKLQSLIAVTLLIVGFAWFFVASQADAEPPGAAMAMVVIGFIWYIVNRFRIWWHHK